MTQQRLTPRELSAIGMAAQGKCMKGSARTLGVSPWTVREARKNALRALGAKTIEQAVAMCVGRGLITADGQPVSQAATAIADQPPPVANDKPAVWDLVMTDMRERDQLGRRRYGVPLQPHNGRDVLVDAYQEALDLAVYLRQAIYERDGK